MRIRLIVAHVATIAVASLGGLANRAVYGFGCFYERHPFGSACSDAGLRAAFLEGAVITAAVIYTIWACVAVIVFLFRRRKRTATKTAVLEVFD